MNYFDFDLNDDDVEVVELIEVGIPRIILPRVDYFDNLTQLEYFKRFLITKETALHILPLIEGQLEFAYDGNNSVSPMKQFLTALRYFATGGHVQLIANFAGVHISTACRIIHRVSRALALLRPKYIKLPATHEEMLLCQRTVFRTASFPRVIGAIDSTHIRIQSPGGNDAEIFRNRKGYFSINVQVVSDASMNITDIVARWPGSAHDATIFNSSTLRASLEQGDWNNAILLGDSAYNSRSYLLTPILNPSTRAEQRYNESHIRTRGVVEKLFGIWKRRFPIMAYGCRLKLDNIMPVIIATAVLHNICQSTGEEVPPLPDEVNANEFEQLLLEAEIHNHDRAQGNFQLRNMLVNQYFANL